MVNEALKADLLKLGLKSDDTILMHSSLSSLGYVEGGAETVIDTLLDILWDGTLLVPALSYAYTRSSKVFSVKDTKSCVGAISEYFRTREGTIRSMHPTHSVCGVGKYAEEILKQHAQTDTPLGSKSPFALLPAYDGKILMLGCGLRPNTSMHGVEELSKPWYLLKEEMEEFQLIDENGNVTHKKYYCHNFAGVAQRYDRLSNVMEIPSGKVLDSTSYLIPAKEMWETADQKIREKEEYFVERRG